MSIRVLCLLSVLTLALPVQAAPEAGDAAPVFSMEGSDGTTYTNETLAGKGYVIAFFPKAFTGG